MFGRNKSKRQKGASTSGTQQPRRPALIEGRFTSTRAREEYARWICNATIVKERGMNVHVPAEWNWTTFLDQPGHGITSIVHEFYANAGDGIANSKCIVQGVEVDFSPNAINAYYGTNTFEEEEDHYHHHLMGAAATDEVLDDVAEFFHPEAHWNIRNGMRAHMSYEFFDQMDRGVIDFVKSRLFPNMHRGAIKFEIVLLAYCIRDEQTINVGRRIHEHIKETATSEGSHRMTLGFPSLITDLCRLAGVIIPTRNEIEIKPLPYISREYLVKTYKHGNAHLNQHQGGDDAMDEGEPPIVPEAAAANPPMQPDYAQYFANQEQFFQEQREHNLWQREATLRQQEAAWFATHSINAQNLANQGLPHHYPHVPPWCNDPQFIPEHMRGHWPPPDQ